MHVGRECGDGAYLLAFMHALEAHLQLFISFSVF